MACGGVRMRYPVPYVLVTEMCARAQGSGDALAHQALQALTTPSPHQVLTHTPHWPDAATEAAGKRRYPASVRYV